MSAPSRHERFALVVILGLAAILLSLQVGKAEPVTADEPGWLSSGYLTWQLITSGAPPSRWETAYDERQMAAWGNLNPPVAKVLIGAVVAAARAPDDPVDYWWSFKLDYAQNLAAGHLPPPSLFTPVREAMVLVAILVLWLAYLCAREAVPSAGALAAPLMLLASAPFVDLSTHVYTDVPQMAGYLLALYLLLRFVRAGDERWLWASAVAGGLACATKFSSAPAVAAAALVGAWLPSTPARRLIRAVGAGALAFAAFVAVNPALYPHPIERSLFLAHGWSIVLAKQRAVPVFASYAVDGRARALWLVIQRALLHPDEPGSSAGAALHWALVASVLLAVAALARRLRAGTATRASWLELGAIALGALLALAPGLAWAGAGLPVAGAVALAVRARRAPQGTAAALALSAALGLVATVLWLPFDWSRYYLPAIVLLAVLAGAGAGTLAQAMRGEQQ